MLLGNLWICGNWRVSDLRVASSSISSIFKCTEFTLWSLIWTAWLPLGNPNAFRVSHFSFMGLSDVCLFWIHVRLISSSILFPYFHVLLRSVPLLGHVSEFRHWAVLLYQTPSLHSIGRITSRVQSPTPYFRNSLFFHLFLARIWVLHRSLVSSWTTIYMGYIKLKRGL